MRQTVFGVRIAHVLLIAYWSCLFWSTHSSVPVEDAGPDIPHLDKFVHMAAYAILGFLLAWSWQTKRCCDARWWAGFAMLAIYAVADEWTQNFVQQRVADLWDGLADLAGGAIGMIGYCVIRHFFKSSASGDENCPRRSSGTTESSS